MSAAQLALIEQHHRLRSRGMDLAQLQKTAHETEIQKRMESLQAKVNLVTDRLQRDITILQEIDATEDVKIALTEAQAQVERLTAANASQAKNVEEATGVVQLRQNEQAILQQKLAELERAYKNYKKNDTTEKLMDIAVQCLTQTMAKR